MFLGMKQVAFQIGQWHTVLAAICGTHAVLRVNDGPHKVAVFSCIPVSYNLDHRMKVGGGFRGQIEQISINFVSVQLGASKVVRVPCFGRIISF